MKFLKVFLWLLLVLLVIYVVLCFASPKKLDVERSQVMNVPAHVVFGQVNDFKNWSAWSPWEELDPNMDVTISENSAGVNAISSWKSETQGSGSQTIIASEPNKHIRTELRFDDWDGKSYAEWRFEELGPDSTNVHWAMNGEEIGFFMRPMNMFMKGMLEEQYDKGLSNLSELVSKLPKGPPVEVFTTFIGRDQWIVTKPVTTSMDQMKKAYTDAFLRVGTFMSEKGLEPVAAPVAVYHEFSPSKIVFETGMPVADSMAVPADLNLYHIRPCDVATATLVGPYSGLERIHGAIHAWVGANGAEIIGSPWEVYMNNEAEVSDPSKLITQVFYPIKKAPGA